MYPVGMTEVIILVILVWTIVLSYFIFKQRVYLKKLFPKEESGDIKDKLDEVVGIIEKAKAQDEIINRNLRRIAKENLSNIQKVSVQRYNPYQDTGGNMSFSLAALDGKGSGFLLTSLHTRSGTRIYIKKIVNGKSDLTLSKEETETLKQTMNE